MPRGWGFFWEIPVVTFSSVQKKCGGSFQHQPLSGQPLMFAFWKLFLPLLKEWYRKQNKLLPLLICPHMYSDKYVAKISQLPPIIESKTWFSFMFLWEELWLLIGACKTYECGFESGVKIISSETGFDFFPLEMCLSAHL